MKLASLRLQTLLVIAGIALTSASTEWEYATFTQREAEWQMIPGSSEVSHISKERAITSARPRNKTATLMPEKADLESFIAAVRAQRERYDAGHLAYEAKLIVAAMGICVGICFALIGLKGWTE